MLVVISQCIWRQSPVTYHECELGLPTALFPNDCLNPWNTYFNHHECTTRFLTLFGKNIMISTDFARQHLLGGIQTGDPIYYFSDPWLVHDTVGWPRRASSSHSCDNIRAVPQALRSSRQIRPRGLDFFYKKWTEAYGIQVLGVFSCFLFVMHAIASNNTCHIKHQKRLIYLLFWPISRQKSLFLCPSIWEIGIFASQVRDIYQIMPWEVRVMLFDTFLAIAMTSEMPTTTTMAE